MIRILLMAGLLFAGLSVLAQLPDSAAAPPPAPSENIVQVVYTLAEQMPEPKGGYPAFYAFLGQELTYPAEAIRKRVEGTVYVEFVVDTSGAVVQERVVRSASPLLEEEALRAIRLSGSALGWHAGKQRGKKVLVRLTMPVVFNTQVAIRDQRGTIVTLPPKPEQNQWVGDFNGNPVYVNPDIWPEAKGSIAQHQKFYQKHLRPIRSASGVYGEVVVSFVVSNKGKIYRTKISQSIDSVLDAEALRLVALFNQEFGWTPGVVRNKKAHVRIDFPVNFIEDPTVAQAADGSAELGADDKLILGENDSTGTFRGKPVYSEVDEDATPIGGMDHLFLSLSLQDMEYPKEAVRQGITGTTFIRFIINEQGIVEYAEVVKDRAIGYGLDEEAMRAIKATKWHAARHQGQPVKQMKIMPMRFKLQK